VDILYRLESAGLVSEKKWMTIQGERPFFYSTGEN
jgi:hypothetical protein